MKENNDEIGHNNNSNNNNYYYKEIINEKCFRLTHLKKVPTDRVKADDFLLLK